MKFNLFGIWKKDKENCKKNGVEEFSDVLTRIAVV